MNVIYTDTLLSASADSEDTNYPASNLEDEHPKKVWKALADTAILTLELSGGGALGIVNTNAISVDVSVVTQVLLELSSDISAMDGLELETASGSGTVDWKLVSLETGDIWISWPVVDSPLQITLTLEAETGTILYAGVCRAGDVYEMSDPLYGLQESMTDYSVIKELSNGSLYYRKRDVVRQYAPSILDDRDSTVLGFMRGVARNNGPAPLMWRLTDLDNSQWIVFARFDQMPQATHSFPVESAVSFSIKEVV